MTVQLIRYETARRALDEARSFDEVKEIRDKSEALRAYARQAGDREMVRWAAEIKVRAERRAGEILRDALPAPGRPKLSHHAIISLKGIGLSLSQSSRWQRMAEVSHDDFEAYIARAHSTNGEITSAAIRNLIAKAKAAESRPSPTRAFRSLEALAASGMQFGCIYADPPWLYDNQGTRASTGNHYGGMTVDQLCLMPVGDLALPDAHLHLWTTNGFLFECPKLFKAWGFEFRSSFIWVKSTMGIGNYWRNSHEILLTAIRGNAKRFRDKSLRSWLECKRGRHSSKPEQVRVMLERASEGPYLELFARRSIKGWTCWGDEAEPDLLSHSEVA